jgi:hypothetical protein
MTTLIPKMNSDFLDSRSGKIDKPWLDFFERLATTIPTDSRNNAVLGSGAIATTATAGFLYIPTCAGVPTGVPDDYSGRSPIVVDSTNNRLYFYSNGAWRNAGP